MADNQPVISCGYRITHTEWLCEPFFADAYFVFPTTVESDDDASTSFPTAKQIALSIAMVYKKTNLVTLFFIDLNKANTGEAYEVPKIVMPMRLTYRAVLSVLNHVMLKTNVQLSDGCETIIAADYMNVDTGSMSFPYNHTAHFTMFDLKSVHVPSRDELMAHKFLTFKIARQSNSLEFYQFLKSLFSFEEFYTFSDRKHDVVDYILSHDPKSIIKHLLLFDTDGRLAQAIEPQDFWKISGNSLLELSTVKNPNSVYFFNHGPVAYKDQEGNVHRLPGSIDGQGHALYTLDLHSESNKEFSVPGTYHRYCPFEDTTRTWVVKCARGHVITSDDDDENECTSRCSAYERPKGKFEFDCDCDIEEDDEDVYYHKPRDTRPEADDYYSTWWKDGKKYTYRSGSQCSRAKEWFTVVSLDGVESTLMHDDDGSWSLFRLVFDRVLPVEFC